MKMVARRLFMRLKVPMKFNAQRKKKNLKTPIFQMLLSGADNEKKR